MFMSEIDFDTVLGYEEESCILYYYEDVAEINIEEGDGLVEVSVNTSEDSNCFYVSSDDMCYGSSLEIHSSPFSCSDGTSMLPVSLNLVRRIRNI